MHEHDQSLGIGYLQRRGCLARHELEGFTLEFGVWLKVGSVQVTVTCWTPLRCLQLLHQVGQIEKKPPTFEKLFLFVSVNQIQLVLPKGMILSSCFISPLLASNEKQSKAKVNYI